MVLKVPVDFDVCEHVANMPRISKVVNPCRYRCVEKLGKVRIYYGRTLIAEIIYRNEPIILDKT